MSKSRELILCPSCEGIGWITQDSRVYDKHRRKCSTCNGQGRVYKVISYEVVNFGE